MTDRSAAPTVRARPIDLIFLVDVSGSMTGDAKIQSLNAAMEESLPFLRQAAEALVGVAPHVRVVAFGDAAEWIVDEPVPVGDFWWSELAAEVGGLTETGAALELVLGSLGRDPRRLPPALVLLSDGMPTDTRRPSFEDALAELDRDPIGGATTRTAVAIGEDADAASLRAFTARAGGEVLDAHDPHRLPELLRLIGTSVLQQASRSA